jgi:hypothetical protein
MSKLLFIPAFMLLGGIGLNTPASNQTEPCTRLQTERDSLNALLMLERSQTNLYNQVTIEKMKSQEYALLRLKTENETLRKIMKSYVYTIDSLNTQCVTLDEKLKKKGKK